MSDACHPMNCSMSGFPVLHYLQELVQTHVHWVSDANSTISSSVIPFSTFPKSFPALGSFPMSQFFESGGIGAPVSTSVLPINNQGWFPLGLTCLISWLSKGLFYLFIYFFIFLTLQYCIGFAIYKMNPPQVYMCSPSWILLPPPSPYHPSGSSQCTSPKHPVSCIEPGLVTCFIHDIIHISVPFSQIIPPSPSPTESKRPFYTSVSLLLSRVFSNTTVWK